ARFDLFNREPRLPDHSVDAPADFKQVVVPLKLSSDQHLSTIRGISPSTPRLHALVNLRADLGSAAKTGKCINTSPARHGQREFHDPNGNFFRSPAHINNPSCYLLKSMGFCLTLRVKSPISSQEEPAHGR